MKMTEDELLDEVCGILDDMETLIRSRDLKEDYFFTQNQRDDQLTVRDFRYQEIQINNYENELEQNAQNILRLFQPKKGILEKLLLKGFFDDYEKEVYNLICQEWSKRYNEWSDIIEKEFVNAINLFKSNPQEVYYLERFVYLSRNLSKNAFGIESDFYKKLIAELKNKNSCIVYWATMILWEKEYTNPATIEAFRKNLTHSDWRIRIITLECLQTWIKVKLIQLTPQPQLFLKDQLRRKLNKDYESKLLVP